MKTGQSFFVAATGSEFTKLWDSIRKSISNQAKRYERYYTMREDGAGIRVWKIRKPKGQHVMSA